MFIISTKGALRRPMTYDYHYSHPHIALALAGVEVKERRGGVVCPKNFDVRIKMGSYFITIFIYLFI